ncbi:peptide-methionine (S)-S-oxide reductase MsrA [Catenovulum sp. 2E275]|uniref:peptide-methionine (S)-S-oxide reductase MsrA n=1 Tax=Catenovulum sp. 2E275 TaxID=2980497 RepID=UPI0021D2A964|nr:peptide-methionine (S)-S-oxide reductase MsrA [Catenovulum sp. 2E275]MCU4674951.1 peptide-methionine (S)-S-oxide reductase MsrA [Catenovulum sp. 2E275]
MTKQTAILAAGCFWCIESAFNLVKGVISATSGYCGGDAADANYKMVCSGLTEHAEAVLVEFDDEVISYTEILEIFFFLHDPTQLNRQGNDIGRQYRSAIFYLSELQKQQAESLIMQLTQQAIFAGPIITQVVEAMPFYPAEDYHQGYYNENPNQGYCQFIIAPKMAKFADKFSHLIA